MGEVIPMAAGHDGDGQVRRYDGNGQVRRYLLVANVTLAGQGLADKVRQCIAAGPCRFHVLVPASPNPHSLTWTEEETRALARRRLEEALAYFRGQGADITGEVGDGMPFLAIEDAWRAQQFDEVIVSTLPHGMSRWLRLDLPHRVAQRFRVPVTHLIGRPEIVPR